MATALIVVDLQNDYFQGGTMELVGTEQAAAQAAQLLDRHRQAGNKIFHIQHLAVQPGASFFIPGTAGCEINAAVTPAGDEPVLQKNYPNSFRETPLHDLLQSAAVDQLEICGAMSHMCIDATTRAAFDLGYACTLYEDACATRDLAFNDRTVPAVDVHGAFMAALGSVYAKVVRLSEGG